MIRFHASGYWEWAIRKQLVDSLRPSMSAEQLIAKFAITKREIFWPNIRVIWIKYLTTLFKRILKRKKKFFSIIYSLFYGKCIKLIYRLKSSNPSCSRCVVKGECSTKNAGLASIVCLLTLVPAWHLMALFRKKERISYWRCQRRPLMSRLGWWSGWWRHTARSSDSRHVTCPRSRSGHESRMRSPTRALALFEPTSNSRCSPSLKILSQLVLVPLPLVLPLPLLVLFLTLFVLLQILLLNKF